MPASEESLGPLAPTKLGTWDNPEVAACYSRFAKAAWYQSVLDTMIHMLPIKPSSSLIDVGCGTGAGTFRLAERAGHGSHIVGIDASIVQAHFAKNIAPSNLSVDFLPYSVSDAVERYRADFDGLVGFNSIHLLGRTEVALSQLASLVKPGGFVAFCTGYHTDARSFAEMKRSVAMFEVMQEIAARHPTPTNNVASGRSSAAIRSVRVSKLESYMDQAGLSSITKQMIPVDMPAESLVEFLALPGMAASILPAGFSREQARGVISEALDICGVSSISRKWLFVLAERREA